MRKLHSRHPLFDTHPSNYNEHQQQDACQCMQLPCLLIIYLIIVWFVAMHVCRILLCKMIVATCCWEAIIKGWLKPAKTKDLLQLSINSFNLKQTASTRFVQVGSLDHISVASISSKLDQHLCRPILNTGSSLLMQIDIHHVTSCALICSNFCS